MEITKQESDGRLTISGALDIRVADRLLNSLRDAYHGGTGLSLDLSKVEQCDLTTLQILYAARKTANSSGKPIIFEDLSPAIKTAGQLLGLSLDELTVGNNAGGTEQTSATPGSGEGTSNGL